MPSSNPSPRRAPSRGRPESGDARPRSASGGSRSGAAPRASSRRSAEATGRPERSDGPRKSPRRAGAPSDSRRDDSPRTPGDSRRGDGPRGSSEGRTVSPRRDRPSDGRRTARPGVGRPGQGRGRDRFERPKTAEEIRREKDEAIATARGWGGVARKGAVHLRSETPEMEGNRVKTPAPMPLAPWVPDAAPSKVKIAAGTVDAKPVYALPGDVVAEVRKAFVGTSYQREKMVKFLTRAAESYDRHRYEEALRLAKAVADQVPGVAPVRELAGLAAYRLERWPMSRAHLKAYYELTGDPQHLPLVMDCERATRRYKQLEKTYETLAAAEPTAEVIAEARIVLAAAWADDRRYHEAIELLIRAGAAKNLRNPSYRHVRLWYALADVYDRAGDVAMARDGFARVVAADPDAYDAAARLKDLGAPAPRKNRKKRTVPVSKKKNVD
ncbi:MAG: hypothetical protein WCJ82_07615 [Actinomycetota bacterium]